VKKRTIESRRAGRGWTVFKQGDIERINFMNAPLPLIHSTRSVILAVLLCSALPALPVYAQAGDTQEQQKRAEQPVAQTIDFSAQQVSYDSTADVVTATGDVILNRQGYSLRADTIVWNRNSGEVTAQGNIRSVGPNGDVAYGDSIQLTDTLKDGVIENFLLVMADGGRLAAQRGTRTGGVIELDYAAYTPCAVERANGCPKRPSWQVKAVKVRYDPVKKRVRYQGARIELFGLPVIPLPFLSHPGESKAGSGFLVPNLRYSRNNGAEIELPYYLRLSPNRDLTVSASIFSKVAPLLQTKFRSIESKGAIEVAGYGTYSSRISTASGSANLANRRFRGYLDGAAKFQLDPYWTASASLRLASDRTFLRRYDISNDDRLRNTISLERIDDRSYFSLAGWAVQTLRTGDKQGLTPIALPEIDYRLRLNSPVLGGKVQLQANSLAIGRTAGQDTQRAFASAQWHLRTITGLGQDVSFTVLGRGDIYHSDENGATLTQVYRGDSGWQTRGIFAAAADIRWPFVGQAFGGTQVLTPRVQIVAAPGISNLRIPNEDSRAVDLEDSNLFALNRFPGYDRFEDNYRVTVGLDWAFRGKDVAIDANVGQSLRLSNRDTIFPDGTGLSEKVSDFVGRTEIRYRDLIKVNHRFRLDKDNLSIRRNEIDATVGSQGTYAQIGYLKLNRNIGPTIEDLADREEVRVAGRAKIARYWSVFGSAIVDLTDQREDPLSASDGYSPIRHRVGISYDDDCLTIGFTWKRDYQATGDARRGNSYLFRLAFRNLGV
jgi:LPS-assembly protein